MKDQMGTKNPMYGKHGWNRGLTKVTDLRVKRSAFRVSVTRKRLFREGKLRTTKGMKRPDLTLRNLTDNPSWSIENRMKSSIRAKKNLGGENNNNRGKHLSAKTKMAIGLANVGRYPSYPKAYFVESLGHKVRSTWEEEICLFLSKSNKVYTYEGKRLYGTVNGRKCSWLPDLLVDGIFVEVKGPFFIPSIKKYRSLAKQNNVKIVFVTRSSDLWKARRVTEYVVSYEDFRRELLQVIRRAKKL